MLGLFALPASADFLFGPQTPGCTFAAGPQQLSIAGDANRICGEKTHGRVAAILDAAGAADCDDIEGATGGLLEALLVQWDQSIGAAGEWKCAAGTPAAAPTPLNVRDESGDQTDPDTTTLKFPDGSVTVNAAGDVSVAIPAANPLTVRDEAGAVLDADVSILRVTDGALTDNGAGDVSLAIPTLPSVERWAMFIQTTNTGATTNSMPNAGLIPMSASTSDFEERSGINGGGDCFSWGVSVLLHIHYTCPDAYWRVDIAPRGFAGDPDVTFWFAMGRSNTLLGAWTMAGFGEGTTAVTHAPASVQVFALKYAGANGSYDVLLEQGTYYGIMGGTFKLSGTSTWLMGQGSRIEFTERTNTRGVAP